MWRDHCPCLFILLKFLYILFLLSVRIYLLNWQRIIRCWASLREYSQIVFVVSQLYAVLHDFEHLTKVNLLYALFKGFVVELSAMHQFVCKSNSEHSNLKRKHFHYEFASNFHSQTIAEEISIVPCFTHKLIGRVKLMSSMSILE